MFAAFHRRAIFYHIVFLLSSTLFCTLLLYFKQFRQRLIFYHITFILSSTFLLFIFNFVRQLIHYITYTLHRQVLFFIQALSNSLCFHKSGSDVYLFYMYFKKCQYLFFLFLHFFSFLFRKWQRIACFYQFSAFAFTFSYPCMLLT